MKIAHAIDAFAPYSHGGAENYAEALANAQLRQHRVVVFHRVEAPGRPEYETRRGSSGAIPVVTLNRTFRDVRSFRDTYESEAVDEAFRAFLLEERPDVVHFHHVSCLSTGCVQVARELGASVVFTLHDFWLLCPRGQLVRRNQSLCEVHTELDCADCMASRLRLDDGSPVARAAARTLARWLPLSAPKALYKRFHARPLKDREQGVRQIQARTQAVHCMLQAVDLCLSPSEFLRDRFVDFGLQPDRIAVLPYGFDLAPWRDVPQQREIGEDAPVRVIYLGTWIPTKGVHLLVEAFRQLEQGCARLDLHGYAPPYEGHEDYEERLRALAAGAPQIHFHGAYSPDELPQLLARADVLVAPSTWYENAPLTVQEAFLAGVVVIASDHGGLRELVVDGENGLTFESGSASALAVALRRLIDDRVLLARLREKTTPVPSIEEHARALDQIYAAAAAAR